jgi:hypothetical protein
VSVVRIEALRALAALIQLEIPELQGHVCTGVAPAGELEAFPNVSIQPTKWTYNPEQAEERATLPGNRQVMRVGEHECACVLSVVATSPAQRWELEDKILNLFLRTRHPLTGVHMPGVIVLPITACPELGAWFATYDLESDEWIDTLALDRIYESRIVITATVPALVVDTPVYTIESLILGVTEDLTTSFSPSTAIPPAVELVRINSDGSIAQWTP